jgi:hypothetical protein
MLKNGITLILKQLLHKITVNYNGQISLAIYYKSLKCTLYILPIFCSKFAYFFSKLGLCGQFGQFKAYYDAQAISKHIIKILKKTKKLLI